MAIAASVKMSKGPSLNIELLHDTLKEIRRLTNSSCVGIYVIGGVREGTARFLYDSPDSRRGKSRTGMESTTNTRQIKPRVSIIRKHIQHP